MACGSGEFLVFRPWLQLVFPGKVRAWTWSDQSAIRTTGWPCLGSVVLWKTTGQKLTGLGRTPDLAIRKSVRPGFARAALLGSASRMATVGLGLAGRGGLRQPTGGRAGVQMPLPGAAGRHLAAGRGSGPLVALAMTSKAARQSANSGKVS